MYNSYDSNRNFCKGDIYYIYKTEDEVGAEIYSGRPAILVGCDDLLKNSKTIPVVFLTTQPKINNDFHTSIMSSGKSSTAICEQVRSVSRDRIGNYLGHCTDEELESINECLGRVYKIDNCGNKNAQLELEVTRYKAQIELLKELLSK